MGLTIAEKIMARAANRAQVFPGEFLTASVDVAMCHEALGLGVSNGLRKAGVKKIWDSDKVVHMLDHFVPAPSVKWAEVHKKIRDDVRTFGIKLNYGENEGVCHQVMIDNGHVLPGGLIVGADSHTTIYGALGVAGTGIGLSEMSYVLATGELWFRVPETIQFVISGKATPMVMSKDVLLHIAGKYSVEVGQYKSIEFVGPAVEQMSVESRLTMSNMAVELGAKFGLFETDEKTMTYLRKFTDQELTHVRSDADATFEKIYHININELEPQVALPYSVDNVKPISQLDKIPINQAVLGSCTNGRIEDLRISARILKNRRVHPDVRMLVVPASKKVYLDAMEEGLLEIFIGANAIICNPSCGPCFGGHMGMLASGENCIASLNRNFKGRMGSDEAKVFLASPATVAASAIEGEVVDPRKYSWE